jgi:hypothetical protein
MGVLQCLLLVDQALLVLAFPWSSSACCPPVHRPCFSNLAMYFPLFCMEFGEGFGGFLDNLHRRPRDPFDTLAFDVKFTVFSAIRA